MILFWINYEKPIFAHIEAWHAVTVDFFGKKFVVFCIVQAQLWYGWIRNELRFLVFWQIFRKIREKIVMKNDLKWKVAPLGVSKHSRSSMPRDILAATFEFSSVYFAFLGVFPKIFPDFSLS